VHTNRIRTFVEGSSASRRAAAGAALALYLVGLAAALGRPAVVAAAALAIGCAAFVAARLLGQRQVDLGALSTRFRAAKDAGRGTWRAGGRHLDRALDALAVHGRRVLRDARRIAAALAHDLPRLLRSTSAASKSLSGRRFGQAPKPVAQLHAEWRQRQALQLNRRGAAARREGRAGDAQAAHRRALEIYREAGDRRREALTLGNLALAEAQVDAEAAVASCEAALAILRELDDAHAEGQVLANLGVLHHRAGRDDAAYRCWGHALERLDPGSPEHARISERLALAG